MSKRASWLIIPTLFAMGCIVGYLLSGIPALKTYKITNLLGTIYALLGVVVLSEILATPRWKVFCVERLALSISLLQMMIPLGVLAGSAVAALQGHRPSSQEVFFFSICYMAYSGLSSWILDEIVVSPRIPFWKKDIDTRWRWLGFILVIIGIVAQLIAAVMDLTQ